MTNIIRMYMYCVFKYFPLVTWQSDGFNQTQPPNKTMNNYPSSSLTTVKITTAIQTDSREFKMTLHMKWASIHKLKQERLTLCGAPVQSTHKKFPGKSR